MSAVGPVLGSVLYAKLKGGPFLQLPGRQAAFSGAHRCTGYPAYYSKSECHSRAEAAIARDQASEEQVEDKQTAADALQ